MSHPRPQPTLLQASKAGHVTAVSPRVLLDPETLRKAGPQDGTHGEAPATTRQTAASGNHRRPNEEGLRGQTMGHITKEVL